MPFKSKAQEKKCFALQSQGKAKGWNCKEWAKATDQKALPKKVMVNKKGK